MFIAVLFAALFGALTKTLYRAAVAVFVVFAGAIAFSIWLSSKGLINSVRVWPWPSPFHNSSATSNLITTAVAALAAFAALGHLYRWRRPFQAICVFFLALWIGNVAGEYWPFDILPSNRGDSFWLPNTTGITVWPGSNETTGPNPDVVPVAQAYSPTKQDGQLQIAIPLHIEGIPPEYFVEADPRWPVRLALSNGREIQGNSAGSQKSLLSMPAVEMALGVPHGGRHSETIPVTLSVSPSVFSTIKGQKARIEGGFRFIPFRYRIAQQFPLVIGRRFQTSGKVWLIQTVEAARNGTWIVVLNTVGACDPARSTDARTDVLLLQDRVLALVNLERKEVSFADSDAMESSSMDSWSGIEVAQIQQRFSSCMSRNTAHTHGIDADWLRHAELLVLAASEGAAGEIPIADGRITIPSAENPVP
jgi:hypothetical protein